MSENLVKIIVENKDEYYLLDGYRLGDAKHSDGYRFITPAERNRAVRSGEFHISEKYFEYLKNSLGDMVMSSEQYSEYIKKQREERVRVATIATNAQKQFIDDLMIKFEAWHGMTYTEKTGETVNFENLTKREASEIIDYLKKNLRS